MKKVYKFFFAKILWTYLNLLICHRSYQLSKKIEVGKLNIPGKGKWGILFNRLSLLVLFLLVGFFLQAQNKVTGISVSTQTGALTYGASSNATYTITLVSDGTSPAGATTLSLNWITAPSGVTYSFSPVNPISIPAGTTSNPVVLTITSAANTPAGTYKFTVTSTDSYGALTSGPASSFVVGVRPIVIVANDQSKTYGTSLALGTSEFISFGLQNGETIGSVTLTSLGAPATAPVAGSPYDIIPSAATGGTFDPSNYIISYNSGSLTVNEAPLTITASDQSKVYGTSLALGSSAFIPSGLMNGETIGSVTLTSAGAINTANAGTYPIIPSAASGGTFSASNYIITYPNGTLTVGAAPLTITANNQSKTYGTTLALGTSAFTPSGLMNGETIGSVILTSAGAINTANAGTYPIIPSGASGGTFNASNYIITYANGTLTVGAAPLTITANNQSKPYGTTLALGTSAFTPSGLMNGETIGSVTLTSAGAINTANAGNYPIVPSAASGGTFTASNYLITYIDGILTVTITSTTIALTSDNNPSCFGSSITLTGTITPNTGTGSIEFFDGAISLGTSVVSGGSATLSTSSLSVGTHSLTAVYSGDLNYGTSTSSVLSQTITISSPATFSYAGTPYCSSAANPSPTFSGGGVAGTFTAPAGLSINSATGQVNLLASTPGTYTVTNTIAAANGCGVVTATSPITITALPVATFSYAGTPYCSSAANPSPTFSGGGVAGTFSAPAGLSINSASGQVNLLASTPGTYTVTNAIAAANGCGAVTATSSITITKLPVATFSYAGTPYCSNGANPSPTFSGGGVAGTFSSTAGLVFVSTTTGQVNLSTSTPGTYTVTNTIAAANGCAAVTATSPITITAAPIATFSYAGTPYCSNGANPLPTFSGGGVAGTFSSTAGLVFVSTATGQVNLSTSTPGTYTVTNTIPAANGCAAVTATSSITITKLPVATFSYAGTPYCSNAANPLPTFSGGGVAGTFSSTAGLVFVSTTTGQVNLSASVAGTYTVTNTVAAANGCGVVTATSPITINALPAVTAGSSVCIGSTMTLSPTGGGTWTSSNPAIATVTNAGVVTGVAAGSATFTFTQTSTGCSNTTTSVTVNPLPTISSVTATPATICVGNSSNLVVSVPGSGATTIVNYDFNSGGNYGALNSNAVSGITSTANGSSFNTSSTSTTTGANAFTSNTTAGNALRQTANTGNNWSFTLGGASLNTYSNFKVYFQTEASSSGQTITVSYNANGTGFTSTGVVATVGSNPITAGNNSYVEVLLTLPAAANNPSSLVIQLTTNNGGNTIRIDNFQVQAQAGIPLLYSWVGAPAGTAGLPGNAGTPLSTNNNISVSPTANTSYTVTATNGNGCSQTGNVNVTVNQPATLSSSLTPPARCSNVSGTYTATSTTGGVTYSWTRAVVAGISNAAGSGNSATITETLINTTANPVNVTYAITLTANGCSNTQNVTVTINPSPTLTSSLTPPGICNNTLFNYNPTSAIAGTTFNWSRAAVAGISNTAASGTGNPNETLVNTLTSPVSVTYVYTLSANGCSNTQNVVVVVSPTPVLTSSLTPPARCSNVSATYTATSATAGVTYAWTRAVVAGISNTAGSGNSATITETLVNTTASPVAVVYAITLTINGCANTQNVTVTVNPKPIAGAITGANNTVCIGSTITLTSNATGIAPLTYSWSSSNGSVVTVNGSGVVTGVGTGTANITYTVTDANGCSATSANYPVTVTKPTANAITQATGINAICVGGVVNLTSNATGTGTLTYTWTSSDNTKATVSNTGVVNGVAAGTVNITYTVTDGNGCTSTSAPYTITINPIPTGAFTATENSGTAPNDGIICAGDPVTFTAPAGYGSYIFKVNGTIVQTGINHIFSSISLTNPSSVTVDVANSSNCGTTFGPIVITVNPLPAATLSADKTSICPGDMVTFTAGGGINYTFKVNGVSVQSGATNTYSSSTLTNGNSITVDATNANGCTATSAPVVITVNSLPSGTLSATATTVCEGDNVTFTATTGFTNYNFKINGVSVQNSASNTYSSNALTNPSVVTADVTNASNCVSTFGPVVVTVNSLPAGTLSATENSGIPNDNSICAGANVLFTATSGFTNYDFRVNGVSKQSGASNTYNNSSLVNNDVVTVVVKNGNNCTATFNSITVTVVPSPAGTLSASSTTVCSGDNITFTATVGFANYKFKINGITAQNGSSNIFSSTGLVNGDVVTVDVTNVNSCLTTFNAITITVNALPSGILSISENSGTASDDGIICNGASVLFTASTGFANYDFLLNGVSVQSGVSNTYTTTSLANGDKVTVAVKNASGCIGLLNPWNITVNTLPVVAPITGTMNVCVNSTTSLTDATSGGTWSSSNPSIATVDASGVVTGVTAGPATIQYTITNANGCVTSVTTVVTVFGLPVVSPITGVLSVCVNSTTLLSNTTSGGIWNSDDLAVATISNTGLVTGVSIGTATISYSVTNGNGCTKTVTAIVTVNGLPAIAAISGTLNVCVGKTTSLSDATPGGVWNSGNTGVATINSSTGVVTGISAGTATINYAVTNGNGCSNKFSVDITVFALPVPTLTGPNPICPNSTGTYTTESGESNYTWTFTGGTLVSGGTSTDNSITILWDQPGPRTIYVNYTNTNGCSGATSATVTTSTGTVPTITGPAAICLNADGNYSTQSGQTGYIWTVVGGTITSGGTSTDNTATVNWNTSGAGSISINFTDVNGCIAAAPTVLPVIIHPLPTATVTGTTSVCKNGTAPVITFTGANGAAPYTFTYNINGGASQTVSTISGNSVTVSAPTGVSGNFTYNLISVADNNSCSQNQTGSAIITVNVLPAATISGTTNVCRNSPSPDITFTGTTGTAPFTFTYNINGGATQTIITSSGNSVTVAAPTATAGSFVYNLLSVSDANSCSQIQSGSVTITINPLPGATINGTASVCQNSASPNITFTGSGGTAPYIFTYNINGGGNLTVTSIGNVASVSVLTIVAGTYTYNLISVQDASSTLCSQSQIGSATVTVNPTSVGGSVNASSTVCSGSNTGILTLTGNTGNVIRWESSSDGGVTWVSIANTTTSLTYNNITVTTQYRAVVQSGNCASVNSSAATITVNAVSIGGSVGNNATVCSGTNSGTLTLTGQTGSVVRWESSIDGGITWATIANTTTSLSYTNLVQTTKFRAVVSNGVCSPVNSSMATITVNPLPTATISGTLAVCQNAPSPVITFTGANGTAPYTFTYKINGGGNLTVTSIGNVATIAAPTATVGIFTYTLVSVQESSMTTCAQNQAGSAIVTVNSPLSPFIITPASATICQGVIQPLSASANTSSTGSVNFSSGNVNLTIPDADFFGNPGSRTSTIAVSGIPAGAIINSVSVNFKITHPYDGDLVLNLQAPNGKVLNLVNQRGGGGSNFGNTTTNTTISSTSINPVSSGSAPFIGVYAPDSVNNVGAPGTSNVRSFSALYSTPNGNWVFDAADVVLCHGFFCTTYTGTLNNWSITINYTIPNLPLNVVWSPVTDLYTDPGATTAYTGQSLSTVYAKPSNPGSVTYTATATNANGCNTSQTVNMSVNQKPVVTITANYCAVPGKVQLTANSIPAATSYLWSTGASTQSINVDVAGEYDVTVFSGNSCPGGATINVAQELVVNGDFEQGNVGFTSDYAYKPDLPGLVPPGQGELYDDSGNNGYSITPSGQNVHINFWGHDHTTGTGNFMAVNGHGNTLVVWKETVNVLPNTTYYFSAWAMSLNSSGNNAQLQFSVNGTLTGTTAVLANHGQSNGAADNWIRFYGTWTSGPTTTSAVIYINDLQAALSGNDFGLDDISFGTLSTFITLESAPGTDAQTICVNSPITNIVYNVGNGNPSGPTVTGLPAGVSSLFTGDKLTISGTPTIPGNYTYTLTTTGCNPITVTGTIAVQAQSITLSSGSASTTVCVNTPVNIGYTIGGTTTGATVTGLPAGVTGTLTGKTFSISGTPTTSGSYPYTIITSGICTPDTLLGTITVQSQTITLNSGNTNQTVCINTAISNIQYTIGGTGTGATVNGLPAGVSFSFNSGILIINGTPTTSGIFNYTINTSGNCASVSATGTITVTPNASFSLTSGSGSDLQTVCINTSITDITYAVNNATSANVSGLPAGVTGLYNAGVFTISGTPSVGGTFNYIITTIGGCSSGTIAGTITVQSQTINLTSGIASPSLCVNTLMPDIVYTIGGTATNAIVSGLPAGVIYTIAGNTITINGTPTVSGSFTYTLTTSGACSQVTAGGIITVQPAAIGGTLASVSSCGGGSGTITLTGHTGTILRWEYSIDGGITWTNIANTSISQPYNNITTPTIYRVLVSNGCGPVYSSTATISIHNYWTGITNTDWNTVTNWSDGKIPSMSCPDVYIPGGTPNQPTLGTGVANVMNLHIFTGAVLTVDNATLQIAGTITNSGTMIASNGTIELNGSSPQTIAAGTFQNNNVKDLIISNSSIAGVTLGGALDIYESLIYGASGTNLNTGGFLTLKSNATQTAWIGDLTGHTINGDVTVERFINTGTVSGQHIKAWEFLATPTQGQTVKQSWMENGILISTGFGTQITSPFGAGAGFDLTSPAPSMKYYDPASALGWTGITNTANPVYDPRGYMLFVRGDRSVNGTTVTTPNQTTLRTKGRLLTGKITEPIVAANSFASIGNPYASAIDMRKVMADKTGFINEFFTVWNSNLSGNYGYGAYQTYSLNPITGNYESTPGPVVNNLIQSGEAFFVQTTGAGGGNMVFNEPSKANGSSLSVFRVQRTTGKLAQLRTNLYAVNADGNSNLTDGTLQQFRDDYSNDIDGMDARKIFNSSENLAINSGGKYLIIERRQPLNLTDTIFYNLTGEKIQPYRFEFIADNLSSFGLEGFVEDTYLHTKTPLSMEGTTKVDFSVTNTAGSYSPDRFRIVFEPSAALPVTIISLKAYQKNADIEVDWNVENENNMQQYEVEKSLDGSRFVKSAVISANNNGVAAYSWIDKSAAPGYNYYRIRIIDNNGQVTYTNIVKVLIPALTPEITIHPNPITNGVINLHLIKQPAGMYGIRLLNPLGQIIVARQITRAEGSSTEQIKWDYSLAHGVYQLEIAKPDGSIKVIKIMY